MHFENFNVEVFAQRLRDLFHEAGEQIDPKAHVARAHDGGVAGGGIDLCNVGGRQAGGADDMDDARLRGKAGIGDGRGRRGKVDQAICLRHGGERVGGDDDAELPGTRKQARVLSDGA